MAEKVNELVAASDTPEQKACKIYAFITTLDNWSYQPAREAQADKVLGIKSERGAKDVLRRHGGWHDATEEHLATVFEVSCPLAVRGIEAAVLARVHPVRGSRRPGVHRRPAEVFGDLAGRGRGRPLWS